MNYTETKCCEHCNGMKDITNSCIFCKTYIPNPGSEQAVEKGCTCPRMDNAHGRGYYCDDGSMFVYNMDCPLHKDLKIKK